MPCINCQCPFYAFQRGAAPAAGEDSECVVEDCVHPARFEHGEVLFMQGQPSASLYALAEGTVKICTHTPDGREHIIGMSSPNSLLVGLQSLSDERYAYTAIATTPVRACRINHRTLLSRLDGSGDISIRLINAFNAQLAHSRALMEVVGHHCAACKIASFLLLMTPKSEHGNCEYSMPFSRVEMANLLGLSEETVCRSMARMKREDVIFAPRGHIEIRDWDKLQQIAEDCSGWMALE
jgi:CRP/FNR family transcriptional regulator